MLNTTSVRITWKHTPRKVLVDFYTIRVENVESDPDSQTEPPEDKPSEVKETHVEAVGRAIRSPNPTNYEDSQVTVNIKIVHLVT